MTNHHIKGSFVILNLGAPVISLKRLKLKSSILCTGRLYQVLALEWQITPRGAVRVKWPSLKLWGPNHISEYAITTRHFKSGLHTDVPSIPAHARGLSRLSAQGWWSQC